MSPMMVRSIFFLMIGLFLSACVSVHPKQYVYGTEKGVIEGRNAAVLMTSSVSYKGMPENHLPKPYGWMRFKRSEPLTDASGQATSKKFFYVRSPSLDAIVEEGKQAYVVYIEPGTYYLDNIWPPEGERFRAYVPTPEFVPYHGFGEFTVEAGDVVYLGKLQADYVIDGVGEKSVVTWQVTNDENLAGLKAELPDALSEKLQYRPLVLTQQRLEFTHFFECREQKEGICFD